MLADQVDRRHQRLRLTGRRAGPVEVVAVGLRIDLDLALLLVDLRVEHVGATAEVDDVGTLTSSRSSSSLSCSRSQTSATATRSPARPALIRMLASVTRRAKRRADRRVAPLAVLAGAGACAATPTAPACGSLPGADPEPSPSGDGRRRGWPGSVSPWRSSSSSSRRSSSLVSSSGPCRRAWAPRPSTQETMPRGFE